MRSILPLFLLFCLLSAVVVGQPSDTIRLAAKKLGTADVITPVLANDKVEIISGSRFPIEAADLPFSTHVISKEEIRMNGYETLVDALKMAPGIFVSQPGSGIEGETFLMRGLLGNTYTKILINDIPIKPAFIASMPIGAQLPIREAERIEIIYGAGAALYGADASAGVINIITRQSEKPVYMQADLSIGSGEYSSANVLFGGKLGRNRNIFRYFAYGSNTLLEQREVFYDKGVNYFPGSYPWLTGGDTSFVFLRNYAGTAEEPLLTNTPHLSRKFGLSVNFRNVTLSAEIMSRRDHSSLGMNPVAVTYRNPLTYTGETIQRVNLNFFRDKENRNHKTDLTFLNYRMDERSSTLFVQNRLSVELANASLARAQAIRPDSVQYYQEQIFENAYNRYMNGSRFMFGNSSEFRAEHVRNFRIMKNTSLTFGANFKYAYGYPMTSFLSRPADEEVDLIVRKFEEEVFDTLTYPVQPYYVQAYEGNIFAQVFYNGKRVNLVASLNNSAYTEAENNLKSRLLPRLAGLLKISESLNVRTSWGKAFRAPNEFYSSNTYQVSSSPAVQISRPTPELVAETTTSWESGVRIKSGKQVDFDFTWFRNETENLINYGRNSSSDSTTYRAVLGYNNSRNSRVRYTGGQLLLNFTLGINNRNIEGQYKYSWINSNLRAEEESTNYFLPQYSGKTHQLRIIVRPFNNTTMIWDYIRVNSKVEGAPSVGNRDFKYGSLDLVTRYSFTDRFDVYIRVINVFNKEYPGIPASRTPDDLLYNPQSGRLVRLGMNYFLE